MVLCVRKVENHETIKGAVYCRISTVAEMQQHSLESQKKYYKSYI